MTTDEYKKKILGDAPPDTEVRLSSTKGSSSYEDSKDYANNYAARVLYEHWNPSRAGMTSRNPSPVEITFMISIDGVVSNVQISKRSNDAVMTSSVEELVKQIRSGLIKFPSLREASINRPFLQISVTMHLQN